ncbi:MAG TPA: transcription antitermination factor NusB, partial [bacterium]|nr:transcription antitermination factor NusB [bacterium]
MGKRRKARELVLQNLYAFEISGNPIEAVIEALSPFACEDEELFDFAAALLRKTIHNSEILDRHVVETVKNWKFERIALLDRLILRLALCELLFFEEIPPKVTINEAIDLA